MKTIRVGIIGIGNMGSAHAACISRGEIQGMTLAAVCDSNPERLQLCKAHCPEAARFSDYHELISSGFVDAVIIAVPHRLHSLIAIEALEAGDRKSVV